MTSKASDRKQRVVSVKQIQELDRAAIEEYGISSLVLMENAGRLVAQEIKRYLKRKKNPFVCIVCGLGNNAGDGFVAARHLFNAGLKTRIFLIGRKESLKHDALVNYEVLKRCGYPVAEAGARTSSLRRNVSQADVVVDAIFGAGLNRLIEEPFKSIIKTINEKAKYVVSVDIPSGLDAATGNFFGICVKANLTVTFSFAKKGFFLNNGPEYAGKIVVGDIGIPITLIRKLK